MRALPLNKQYNGYNYTQVVRNGKAAIYEQTVGANCQYYEVFAIKNLPEKVIKDTIIPEREQWPKDEDFGYTAWTMRSVDKALIKFGILSDFPKKKIELMIINFKNRSNVNK